MLLVVGIALVSLLFPDAASSLATPSVASSSSEASQLSRSRLQEALSSPSGKLTLSPEIIIPEPTSPTAILLQTTEINSLSDDIRNKAKANAAFLACQSITSLKTFCNEQESVRGNFPGPIPVVYCSRTNAVDENDSNDEKIDLREIADAGAAGIVVPVLNGQEVTSVDDISSSTSFWIDQYRDALGNGLQPIPEVTVSENVAATWKETDIESLVSSIADTAGDGNQPVSVIITINPTTTTTTNTEVTSEADDEESTATVDDDNSGIEFVELPTIPKKLGRTVPIIASIRTAAGENRLSEEVARLKKAGFTGAILRPECVPGFEQHQGNLNLEYLANFWSACIGDLKSTRSKSFNFQSRNYLEKSVPLEWAKYQKSVLDSGALGEAEDNGPPAGFNPDAGDYQGF